MILKIEIPENQYKKFDKYYDIKGSVEDYIESVVEEIEKMEKDWYLKEKKTNQE